MRQNLAGRTLALNPVAVLYVTNALVALVVAWGWHLTQTQQGAVDTIVTGALTIAAAAAARPVAVPVISSAAATVLTAFAAFHLHLDPSVISASVAAGSVLLAWLLHQSVVPAVAARQGVTALDLELAPHRRETGNARAVTPAGP